MSQKQAKPSTLLLGSSHVWVPMVMGSGSRRRDFDNHYYLKPVDTNQSCPLNKREV